MNSIRLMHFYNKCNTFRHFLPVSNVYSDLYSRQHNHNYFQKRDFSLKESVESVVKTQSGIFQSISESTPVEYMQNFVLTIHDTSGLPWWASIVCTTVLVRSAVTLPLAIYQNYILAKVQNLNVEMVEIVKELKKEMALAVRKYKWDEKTAKYYFRRSAKKQWNQLIVRDNCHPFKASLLIWFQVPMWICFSVSLRNLVYMLPNNDFNAQMIFTELSVGGFGWIPNLTEVDSSYVLPVALGIINLLIIEIQHLSKPNNPTKFQKYITNFFRGISILMVPIAANVPSCIVLYWTTSSTYGLMQNLMLMSPAVKRFCRIPKTSRDIERPYNHVLNKFKEKLANYSGLTK